MRAVLPLIDGLLTSKILFFLKKILISSNLFSDKKLAQNQSDNFKILFFGAYDETQIGKPGITTPYNFSTTVGMELLRLSREEYYNLIKRFSEEQKLELEETVVNTIFELSKGHVGIVRCTLDYYCFHNRSGLNNQIGHLFSNRYLEFITSYRAFFESILSIILIKSSSNFSGD